jgi:hypothetical protein
MFSLEHWIKMMVSFTLQWLYPDKDVTGTAGPVWTLWSSSQ